MKYIKRENPTKWSPWIHTTNSEFPDQRYNRYIRHRIVGYFDNIDSSISIHIQGGSKPVYEVQEAEHTCIMFPGENRQPKYYSTLKTTFLHESSSGILLCMKCYKQVCALNDTCSTCSIGRLRSVCNINGQMEWFPSLYEYESGIFNDKLHEELAAKACRPDRPHLFASIMSIDEFADLV